jgi:hypothetical protein
LVLIQKWFDSLLIDKFSALCFGVEQPDIKAQLLIKKGNFEQMVHGYETEYDL